MVPTIVVQDPPDNPQARFFYTSVEISEVPHETFDRPLRERSEVYLKRVGTMGGGIVRTILSIPGVTKVSIDPYEIVVWRSPAFDWREIEAAVLKRFMDAFGAQELQVVDQTKPRPVTRRVTFSRTIS